MTYQELIDKIRNGEKFDFSRWGDGEWSCILQSRPGKSNCDGHTYFPDMGEALLWVLKSRPDYYIGLQNMAHRMFTEAIDSFTASYKLNWCRADIIHRENIKRGLQSLFDALKERDVLLVGPEHLHKLAVKEGWYFGQVPAKNAWLKIEEIEKDINALIDHKDWVILYCCGMPSNVLIDQFQGRVTQVDVGSAFDPYVGVKSRQYHHKLNV